MAGVGVEAAEVDGGGGKDAVDEVFEAWRFDGNSGALVGGVDFDEDIPGVFDFGGFEGGELGGVVDEEDDGKSVAGEGDDLGELSRQDREAIEDLEEAC